MFVNKLIKKGHFPKTFGMTIPNRQFNSGNYRYSYNGKEQDNEVKGTGNSLDFGARIYDSRLGRWLSVDPLSTKFPWQSPYASMDNNPILFIDDGGKYPIKPQVTGVTALIYVLKANGVKDLGGFLDYYGGLMGSGSGSGGRRYLYSKSNGWIDMKHVSAAAYSTDMWFMPAWKVKRQGEQNEKDQETGEPSSAWSYEDLPSNQMGIELEEYFEKNDGEFLDVLEKFLKEKGFVENPLEVAPNANEIPESYPTNPNTPPPATNKTYTPLYTIPENGEGTESKVPVQTEVKKENNEG